MAHISWTIQCWDFELNSWMKVAGKALNDEKESVTGYLGSQKMDEDSPDKS